MEENKYKMQIRTEKYANFPRFTGHIDFRLVNSDFRQSERILAPVIDRIDFRLLLIAYEKGKKKFNFLLIDF